MYVVAKILVWVLTHCWFFLKKDEDARPAQAASPHGVFPRPAVFT